MLAFLAPWGKAVSRTLDSWSHMYSSVLAGIGIGKHVIIIHVYSAEGRCGRCPMPPGVWRDVRYIYIYIHFFIFTSALGNGHGTGCWHAQWLTQQDSTYGSRPRCRLFTPDRSYPMHCELSGVILIICMPRIVLCAACIADSHMEHVMTPDAVHLSLCCCPASVAVAWQPRDARNML